ncbi:MAG: MotA/TolQ/ExbB proton channel family protein [Thermoguttaceae bacterium]
MMRHRLLPGSRRASPALLLLALFIVGTGVALAWIGGPPAFGAEEAPADLDLGPAPEPAPAPAAPAAPAAGAPAPAAAPAAEAPPPQKSFLAWLIEALGWSFTIIFLGISFAGVAFLVMNILAIRRDAILPATLIQGFEAHLNEKRYQEAYELAKSDESFLGRVLAAGMEKLQTGYEQALSAMQEVGEEENMKLEHRLSYMGLIGTIAPMVGLLGTVVGMVESFSVIAASTVSPKPSELAEGISKALVTTLVGLNLAIPALAFYHVMRNRMARLVHETGMISESLMSRFQKK